ncbi:DUF3291 domain-containing protein [Streptomyces sp. 2BBP-J2]|uniref:DUF3291 domain-containing protein n=1 Tax=Streptomyces sp. 2BBP-J2 TaxID=2719381 RepID=UPI0014303B8C|nr:DUF3291 domain-containing protein [Streptomyces sp. 2BBP-J2]NIL54591.1 DUF3291 domain-containing protein [Streptomyces sp. 2BBP-J2]
MTAYELAQVNIARLKAPLDTPLLKDFVDNLDPVNADADAADGFVWRLQSDDGDATAISVFGDPWLIINMSVWRDQDALTAFMYRGRHREMLSRRREWFERVEEAMTTLWWVPAGHRPSVAEAENRLLHLRAHGPTPYAFTLRTSFPPGAAGERQGVDRSATSRA